MSFGLEEVTAALREKVLVGVFPPNQKLREVTVAEELNVSRTLARLAMSALEHEGLLRREANRGSQVRRFSIDEITEAIEVRGELEAMAVRKAAEHGLDAQADASLRAVLDASEQMLTRRVKTEEDREEWIRLNAAFHDGLITASRNWAIKTTIDQISNLPLVSASALIFDRSDTETARAQIVTAHHDHMIIFEAVRNRQGQRAEARMREHAFRSAANKRANLTDPNAMALARSLPGGALIAEP